VRTSTAAWRTVLLFLLQGSVGTAVDASQAPIPILVYHRLGPVVADSMTVTTRTCDVQSHTYWHPKFSDERRRRSPSEYERFIPMREKNV